MTTHRAALYVRLSRRTDTNEPGLDAQLAQMRQLAADQGWLIVAEIEEIESAYDNEGGRPGFGRLINLIRSGDVDVIAARHPDRFTRNDVESALLRRDLERHGVKMVTTHGEADMSNPSDAMLATVTSAIGTYESAVRRERLLAKHADLAARGQISGGGNRPYGYTKDQTEIVEDEAAVIRAVVANLIAGASTNSEVQRLKAEGVPTARGGQWNAKTLTNIVTGARIAGHREHRGKLTRAVWPAIIPLDELDRVRAAVEARRLTSRRAPRSYLLTGGIARCGKCGADLVARPRPNGSRGYFCARDHGGCNGTRVSAEIEEHVTTRVIAALDGPELGEMTRPEPAPMLAELRDLDARSRSLTNALTSGVLSPADYDASVAQIAAQRRIVEDRLASIGADPLGGIAGTLAAAWPDLPVSRRREIVALIIEHVVVGPGVRGRKAFDPDRVSITWRA